VGARAQGGVDAALETYPTRSGTQELLAARRIALLQDGLAGLQAVWAGPAPWGASLSSDPIRLASCVPCRRVRQLPQYSGAARWCLSVLSCRGYTKLGCDGRGWLGAVGTGQDGLESRGQEIGCVATDLIACLLRCLQSRVRK
jgi:hypothetical protein